MRILLFIFLVLSLCSTSFSQKNSLKFPFNEIEASVNKIPNFKDGDEGYFGFGIGINRSLRDTNRVGIIIGLHFTHTQQYVDYSFGGRWTRFSDINFSINTLSIPYYLRFRLGKKKRFFIETGVSLDIILGSNASYTHSWSEPITNDTIFRGRNHSEYVSKTISGAMISLHFALAQIIDIKGREFFIKPELNYGLGSLTNQFLSNYQSPSRGRLTFISLTVGYKFNKQVANSLQDSWINEPW